MTTIRAADTGRLTIAEAKRLILENSPRESFARIYERADGEIVIVPDVEPSSIFAGHLHEDFAANCERLGIVPRFKYRPGVTGYTGDSATDALYTIEREELAQLAKLHGLTLDCASAEPAPLLALVAADAGTPAENADAPVAAAVPSVAPLGKATTPPPLTTPDIADAFDGIDGQTAQQWRDKLGDVNNHQWLIEARAQKAPAPRPATWWPIKLAELLRTRDATDESLNRAFATAPKLKPWLPLWQEKRRERNAFGQ